MSEKTQNNSKTDAMKTYNYADAVEVAVEVFRRDGEAGADQPDGAEDAQGEADERARHEAEMKSSEAVGTGA